MLLIELKQILPIGASFDFFCEKSSFENITLIIWKYLLEKKLSINYLQIVIQFWVTVSTKYYKPINFWSIYFEDI